MIHERQGADQPTSATDELGARVAAAVHQRHRDRDPVDAELAKERIRASVLDGWRTIVQVGRYVVLERIGAGGMGVVYAAYDPELDRKVALKVLHHSSLGHGDGRRPRLLREAQAMAKLSHPNVVTVYDVGVFDRDLLQDHPPWIDDAAATRTDESLLAASTTDDPRMFVAMELIDGETLATWLRRAARSPAEILRVMMDAGAGLSAAHVHGLVHRDFKPDNVMIDRTDRVRVMDFGLAAAIDSAVELVSVRGSVRSSGGSGSTSAPRGGLAGTPAYMAPEQFLGLEVTPAADQFAFCITLWEALFGHAPFEGDSLPDLCTAVLEGRVVQPPRSRAPLWLRRVLERGLATEPAKRWSSMTALLDALDHGRRRVRRHRAYLAVGALVLAGVASLGFRVLDRRQRTAECERIGASIEEIWNDGVRDRVRAAVVATGLSYASATADRIVPWLDERADGWGYERAEACLDADVRGVVDAEMADRSAWCFDHHKSELDALVTELQQANAPFVQGSITAVSTWVSLGRCRDAAQLAAMQMPPAEHREAARAVGRDVARALALRTAGKHDEGLEVLRGAIARAEAIGYEPQIASARVLEGSLLSRKGENARAEEIVTAAYFQAARLGSWDTASNAASNLVYIVGVALARPREGLAWALHGEMAESHSPDRGGLRASMRKGTVAVILASMGEYAEAVALSEEQLVLREALLGPDHPDVAVTLHNLGLFRILIGDHDEARALLERALVIRTDSLGPEHPDVADTVDDLGSVLRELGDLEGARRNHERALAIRVAAYGREHRKVGGSLTNIALTLEASGDLAGAIVSYEEALTISEKAVGPEHPNVATVCSNLGAARIASGDVNAGRALLERAVAIFESNPGMQIGEADASFRLARVLVDDGEHAQRRAHVLAERALADHRAASRDDEVDAVEAWLAAHPARP
jgi:eukaryotic-like serine/threonine-protein kinase